MAGARNSRPINAVAVTGSISNTSRHVASHSPPMSQNTSVCRRSPARYSAAAVRAEQNALMAIPARSSEWPKWSERRDRANTAALTTNPPATLMAGTAA